MKKRLLAITSLLLILCTIISIPALALEEEPVDPIDPESPYVDLSQYSCGCSINSSGRAYCSSYAQTAHSTYKVYVNVTLQRYKDGYWQTYAGPWYGSGTNGYAGAYGYYYVVSGYYYRAASSVTVQKSDGTYVESAYLNSASRYY